MRPCTKKISSCFKNIVLFFLVSALTMSCSITGDALVQNINIPVYAEMLFKRQNSLTQQVMMLFEDDLTVVQEDEVSLVELQMHDACHLLNEYANREIEGEKISIFFQKKVQGSFQDCEAAVLEMEEILLEINNSFQQK